MIITDQKCRFNRPDKAGEKGVNKIMYGLLEMFDLEQDMIELSNLDYNNDDEEEGDYYEDADEEWGNSF
jgi:hypothetical protein